MTYNLSVNMYKLLAYIGFYNLFFTVILIIIFQQFKCSDNKANYLLRFCNDEDEGKYSFIESFKDEVRKSKLFILSSIIFIFASMFYHILVISIIYFLGPTFRIMADILGLFIITFIGLFTNKKIFHIDSGIKTIAIICYFISFFTIFFGNAVYNEIVVIDLWNLDKDSKYAIHRRGSLEVKIAQEDMEIFNEELMRSRDEKDGDDSDLESSLKGTSGKNKKSGTINETPVNDDEF